MKIIDYELNGNVIRLYLGRDELEDWYGDDWNDCPYEHNAGTVYDEFIAATVDYAAPFDALVLEPADGHTNSTWTKNDMKNGAVPCIVVVPAEYADGSWDTNFDSWVGNKHVTRIYMGDYWSVCSEPERLAQLGYKRKQLEQEPESGCESRPPKHEFDYSSFE